MTEREASGQRGRADARAPAHASARSRAAWGRCRAHARNGERCGAEGSGLGGLCPQHGGLALNRGWRSPLPVWSLLVTASGVRIAPNRRARTWRKEAWPAKVRPWVAVRLIVDGRISTGVFHRGRGTALLAELERRGVLVLDEGEPARLLRRVRFDASQSPEGLAHAAKREADKARKAGEPRCSLQGRWQPRRGIGGGDDTGEHRGACTRASGQQERRQ